MKILKNFILVITSIFLTLIVIEIMMSFFYPQARNGSWRIQNEDGVFVNKDKGKSRHEYIGKKEKISITYSFGEFHNRIILKDKYSVKENKILVLGDSNIFGWLLKDEDTFITKIQKLYNNFYFINSAAGGFSDTDMFLFIDRYCKKIQPKFILFFLDVDRSIRKKNMTINQDNQLIITKNEHNNLKEYLNDKQFFFFLLENLHIMQLIKTLYVNLSNNAYIDYVVTEDPNLKKIKKKLLVFSNDKKTKEEKIKIKEEKIKIELKKNFLLISKLYNKIIESADSCNSKIIFIDIGWYDKTYNSDIYNHVVENFYKIVEQNKQANFISIYDEMKVIRKSNKNYKLEEGHPNAEGNLIIYNFLKDKLKKYLN